MKLELTKKDIFLLKAAVSILLAFLAFRFLIMPGITGYQEKALEAEELTETRAEMEAAIDNIPGLEQDLEKYRRQLEEASAPYYAPMENSRIDELLTGLALKLGLFPVSLSIQNPEPGIPAPYLYVKSGQPEETSDAESAENTENTESTEDVESTESTESTENAENAENTAPGETGGTGINNEPCILIGTVSFTMRGTQEQMFSFVDQLEQNYPAVHIRSMQMNPRVFLDSGWEAVEELEAAFELEIYMYEDPLGE